MKYATYLILTLLFLSCKTKKISNENVEELQNKLENIENSDFKIQNLDTIDKQDLLFSIKEVKIIDKQLTVNLQYGGGCVSPHVFELVSNGLINKKGEMHEGSKDSSCFRIVFFKPYELFV